MLPSVDMNRPEDVKVPLLSSALQELEDGHSFTDRSGMDFPTVTGTVGENSKKMGQGPQPSGSSVLQSILNGMNMLAGIGILSMPYAVSQGGWLGLSMLFLFAAVCCYTGVLLYHCLNTDPQLHSFPDVGEAAFGKLGRIFVSVLLYLELYALAVEYLILEGDNLAQVVSWDGFRFGIVSISSEESFIIISALLMLPTVWLRDLGLLSYISAGGVAACIVVLLTVAWVGLFDVGFTGQGRLLNLQSFPVAVGLYAFCYCGHALFPSIYASMKDKTKFSIVLIVCFILCTLIYGCIAVLGFLMFGDSIKSQVTLNLPTEDFATKVAIFATLVNPFTKYALTVTPLATGLEDLLPLSWRTQSFVSWGILIRTLLVASTVIVALTIPFFAYLMALIGSFLSTNVAITIPCACYLKIFAGRVSSWEMVLMFVFIVIREIGRAHV